MDLIAFPFLDNLSILYPVFSILLLNCSDEIALKLIKLQFFSNLGFAGGVMLV
jgi:hypothetical protein